MMKARSLFILIILLNVIQLYSQQLVQFATSQQLIYAIQSGASLDTIKQLLDNGANPFLPNDVLKPFNKDSNPSPFAVAVKNNKSDIVDVFIKSKYLKDSNAVSQAFNISADESILKSLIANGAVFDSKKQSQVSANTLCSIKDKDLFNLLISAPNNAYNATSSALIGIRRGYPKKGGNLFRENTMGDRIFKYTKGLNADHFVMNLLQTCLSANNLDYVHDIFAKQPAELQKPVIIIEWNNNIAHNFSLLEYWLLAQDSFPSNGKEIIEFLLDNKAPIAVYDPKGNLIIDQINRLNLARTQPELVKKIKRSTKGAQ